MPSLPDEWRCPRSLPESGQLASTGPLSEVGWNADRLIWTSSTAVLWHRRFRITATPQWRAV